MNKSIILLLLTTALLFSGCSIITTKTNLSKDNSTLTSKQLEKRLNWKYCEESK